MTDPQSLKRERLLEELEEIRRLKNEYRGQNRIEFFEPFYYQDQILKHLHAGKKTLTLQGANQIGKTVLGACITGSCGLDIQPWDGHPTVWAPGPKKIRIICADWEHHADEVIVPELKHWLPKGRYVTEKNNVGTEAFWTFPDTGTTIEILTHGQKTEIQGGWKGHLVWADEPLPRDKYVENSRGLVAYNGIFLLTMTAVSESWILDEIVLNPDSSHASVTEIPMRDNPTLSEESIKQYESKLLEREKIPRIFGGWLNLVGLVWGGFRKDAIDGKISHLIDDFEIPTDYPVVPMIDFHLAEPQAIGYYATDRQGRWFAIKEEWNRMSAEETADSIIRNKLRNAWRIDDAFIDPLSKGDAAYVKQRGIEIPDAFTVIRDRLWKERIELHVASKDKVSGIKNIEDKLNGPSGLPTLFFFRSLAEYKDWGHIYEIQRWTYKDGKPRDENDHFMENLYRMSLTGVKWTPPRDLREPLASKTEFNVFT